MSFLLYFNHTLCLFFSSTLTLLDASFVHLHLALILTRSQHVECLFSELQLLRFLDYYWLSQSFKPCLKSVTVDVVCEDYSLDTDLCFSVIAWIMWSELSRRLKGFPCQMFSDWILSVDRSTSRRLETWAQPSDSQNCPTCHLLSLLRLTGNLLKDYWRSAGIRFVKTVTVNCKKCC